jgi:ATP-dependent 26S proteasome regulatory subunit
MMWIVRVFCSDKRATEHKPYAVRRFQKFVYKNSQLPANVGTEEANTMKSLRISPYLSLVLLLQLALVTTAFFAISARTPSLPKRLQSYKPFASKSPPSEPPNVEQNDVYIQGLIDNLTEALDRWVITGSPVKKTQVLNILRQIKRESKNEVLTLTATRLAKRAGFPFADDKELGKNDSQTRRREAEERTEWEKFRESVEEVGNLVGRSRAGDEPRSILSARLQGDRKRDLFMGNIDGRLVDDDLKTDDVEGVVGGKTAGKLSGTTVVSPARGIRDYRIQEEEALIDAQLRASELIARAGPDFHGEKMGIGGLDDVLAQVKRRVWVPLAAPPVLLRELGISGIRGLLLYGKPGCGKTLIARTIGRILSPFRPVTVVSGPELMDKFVGSSEQNVRKLFDEPPPIYDHVRVSELDDGNALSKVAIHVIIMDEFDAMARARGGQFGDGNQGDAGVARDSVVNQILARMDGVDPLPVPTLVIGMTNKRSLIDPALLRPGRFEVQIEVPPPRTQAQRVSILKVHMNSMFEAGRLLVSDAPEGSAASRRFLLEVSRMRYCLILVRVLVLTVRWVSQNKNVPSYEELISDIARSCEGFTGAALAGVARAAASHALERAVTGFSDSLVNRITASHDQSILDCLVTEEDLKSAIQDVNSSSGRSDWSEDEADLSDHDADATLSSD